MPVLVLHTTETDTGTAAAVAANLVRDGKASHRVYDPVTGEEIVIYDWAVAALSLKNLTGGVETNRRGGVYQVELVGRAGDVAGYNDDWYRNVGAKCRQWCAETGTPFTFPCPFLAGSYAERDACRLTFDQWLNVAGVVGHEHVPENDHWDPGRLDVNRLIVLSSPVLEAVMALEPTTPITVDGHQYALVDVLGWTLEGINALRRAQPPTSPAYITDVQIQEALRKVLKEGVG